jgi:precorrin-2 dehydrogenase / sirohydrochlorin ferrochelatase
MLPLVLDVSRLKLALIGNGGAAERRLALLDDAGAANVAVYATAPSAAFARRAGKRLVRRLPRPDELESARVLFISNGGADHHALALTARAAGVLVHIEDEPSLSDVHAPAVVRRGDLVIAVSTGGRSPALAAQIKRFLGALFGAEWQGRLDELALLRRHWRKSGANHAAVVERTKAWTFGQQWLPTPARAARQPRAAAH